MRNKTQFKIVHTPPAYFYSGKYFNSPRDIKPYSYMIFSCCKKDYSFAGATGGTAFRIVLDNAADYSFSLVSNGWEAQGLHTHYWAISIWQGWSCPYVGPFTAGVAASANAEDGYNSAGSTGVFLRSTEEFSGLDENGKEKKFHFEFSASPSYYMATYTISQVFSKWDSRINR